MNQVARVSASVGRVCESGGACFSLSGACVCVNQVTRVSASVGRVCV